MFCNGLTCLLLAIDTKFEDVVARQVHVADISARDVTHEAVVAVIDARTEACITDLVESLVGVDDVGGLRGVELTQPSALDAYRHFVEQTRAVHHPIWCYDRTLRCFCQMTLVPVVRLDEAREERLQADIELRIVKAVVTIRAGILPDMCLTLPLGTVACRKMEDASLVEAWRRNGETVLLGRHHAVDSLLSPRLGEACLYEKFPLQLAVGLSEACQFISGSSDLRPCRLVELTGCCHRTGILGFPRIAIHIGCLLRVACQADGIGSITAGTHRDEVVGKLRFLFAGHILVDLAHKEWRLLGLVVEHESARLGHRVPVVTTPALNHQQEVQSTVVLLIIRLKEIARVLHEASYLAGQEHFRQDVTVVVKVLAMCCVTDRDADRSARLAAFHSNIGWSKRFQRLFAQAIEAKIAWRKIIFTAEEESVRIDTPYIIIYSNLADACLQLRLIKGECG